MRGFDIVSIYGQEHSERALSERTGSLEQFAGVRLVTLEDGAARGVRCLEFRTGGGLNFDVLIDRAFDLGDANYRGASLGWHSPTGFRNPALHEHDSDDGLGWLRSFSGLMMTCGLDHALAPGTFDASHFTDPHRSQMRFPVHGRIALTPGQLRGYGTNWESDVPHLWCEGSVTQASVFGEHLELVRRIEAPVGGKSFRVSDRVTNRGFSSTPHMYMYHINVGYPVLDEGSRYLAPIAECLWSGHDVSAQGVGYRTQAAPRPDFSEQVYEHRTNAEADGSVPVALVNDSFADGRGIGLQVEYQQHQLPCLLQWQCYQQGLYAMGIEPCTNHVTGKETALERQELQWLEHGGSRSYDIRFEVLDGAEDISRCEQRIRALGEQLQEEFVRPTNNWYPLSNTGRSEQ